MSMDRKWDLGESAYPTPCTMESIPRSYSSFMGPMDGWSPISSSSLRISSWGWLTDGRLS